MKHPMELVCTEYALGPQEKKILPYVGRDNLFGVLKMELGHVNLIRNSSLMHWNMEVQPTSNYFLAMGLQ